VRIVADLVRALLAARERDDVALAQLLLALVRAERRLAAEDDHPFLVRVVGVKWPLLVTRLDLVHARADQLGVGVRADPSVLEAPALALFRAIPLVCVEIEDLHAASLRSDGPERELLAAAAGARPHDCVTDLGRAVAVLERCAVRRDVAAVGDRPQEVMD